MTRPLSSQYFRWYLFLLSLMQPQLQSPSDSAYPSGSHPHFHLQQTLVRDNFSATQLIAKGPPIRPNLPPSSDSESRRKLRTRVKPPVIAVVCGRLEESGSSGREWLCGPYLPIAVPKLHRTLKERSRSSVSEQVQAPVFLILTRDLTTLCPLPFSISNPAHSKGSSGNPARRASSDDAHPSCPHPTGMIQSLCCKHRHLLLYTSQPRNKPQTPKYACAP